MGKKLEEPPDEKGAAVPGRRSLVAPTGVTLGLRKVGQSGEIRMPARKGEKDEQLGGNVWHELLSKSVSETALSFDSTRTGC